MEIKTLAILAKEKQAYFTARKLQKTMVAQQMAKKYYEDHKPEKTTAIPEEYQQHAKVFSEKEAEHFPLSQDWDHCIPLKSDAPGTINVKLFSLPTSGREAIEQWVQKMLDKNFITHSDSKYRHATFIVSKKDRTFHIVQDY